MSIKLDGGALMFGEDQVRSTRAFLPRLIRIIFFGLSISNNDYISRYQRFLKASSGGKTTRESNQKIASDRKFLQDKHNLTFKLMNHVLIAMGLDIEAISVRTRDRITDEVRTFSTDDTVDSLKKALEKENTIGITSLFGTPSVSDKNPVATLENEEGSGWFVVVNIVLDKDKDPMSDIGAAEQSKQAAIDQWLDDAIEINENVEEARMVTLELAKVPVGTSVIGEFTKSIYMVTRVPRP
jgi:hypothetical protein